MAEEQATTAEVEAAATPEAVAQPAEAAEQPEPIDLDALDNLLARAYESDPKATADRLKKHRGVAGIAGSIAEGKLAELKRHDDAQRASEAATKAREELRRMAQEEPLKFSDMFLSHDDAEQAKERILSVERNTAKKMMEQIGEAYHGLPEWQNLSDDEKAKLSDAVSKEQDNPLPAFNRIALDIVAARRADKLLSDRLPKEKEAWKKEWEAERLTSEGAPDLRRATSTTARRVTWQAMPDKDFDEWYDRTKLGKGI